jgi:Right handed beta helix region
MKTPITALMLAVIVVAASSAKAGNDEYGGHHRLHVCQRGCRFEHIQKAVDAARSGDTIEIGPGIYFENVVINGKDLTVAGSSADKTTVDGRFRAPVFSVGPLPYGLGLGNSVTLSGMTITHGRGTMGGGVSIGSTLVTISDSVIVSNVASESGGGVDTLTEAPGTDSTGDISTTIERCVVIRNRAPSGGGIHASAEVNYLISHSTVAHNKSDAGGGVFIEYASRSIIENSTISENASGGDGGGIWIATGGIHAPVPVVTLTGDAIVNNTAALSAGGVFSPCSRCLILKGETVISLNTP